MTKLSKVQLEVIRLMKEGWEIHRDMTYLARVDLDNPESERMEFKRISVATWYRLYKLGLVKLKSTRFPIEVWELTEEGKKIKT